MDKQLHDAREDYQMSELNENQVAARPLDQFKAWFEDYKQLGKKDYNSMLLTTVKPDGSPASRIVLLKGLSENGLEFFTNYNSSKAQEIAQNPKVALTFFWPDLERQIRIEGKATKSSDEQSDGYFGQRPRGSQIGAWASPQSEIIESRKVLDDNLAAFEEKFKEGGVPRPPHWGGFVVIPERVEFWQGRTNRLHDRIVYQLDGDGWRTDRLAP